MTTKPLLSTDSPTYLRRLVRELNGREDGFYCGGQRYSAARIRAGQLQAYRGASYVDPQDPRAGTVNPWREVDAKRGFVDAYGRTVCASRRA